MSKYFKIENALSEKSVITLQLTLVPIIGTYLVVLILFKDRLS